MALIPCTECGNQVSDKAEMCPKCGNPISSAAMDKPASQKPPNAGGESSLIECRSCQQPMAKSASNCQSCGARNEWIHPMISKFVEAVGTSYTGPEFHYEHDSTELWGHVEKWGAGQKLMLFSLAIGLVGLLITIFLSLAYGVALIGLAAVLQGVGLIMTLLSKDSAKEFHVEFMEGEFNWTSNDEVFWRPLRHTIERVWGEQMG